MLNREISAIVLVLSLPFVVSSSPVPSAQQRATRPDYLSGLSRSDAQNLRSQLLRTEQRRQAIAGQYRLSRDTIDAIAEIVGATNPHASDSQLVEAVRTQAEQAANVLRENTSLREQLAQLSDPAVRDPALAALRRAETAFNEGRFADAEREYEFVANTRWDETDVARSSWAAAVAAQARTAELSGNFDLAEDIRIRAAAKDAASIKSAIRRQFDTLMTAAQARYREGIIFGRVGAFTRSIHIYRDLAEPIVTEEGFPDLWSALQADLGSALLAKGERTSGQEGLSSIREAIKRFQNALRVRSEAQTPLDWARILNNLGQAYEALAERASGEDYTRYLQLALRGYEDSLQYRTRRDEPLQWANTKNNIGNIYSFLGENSTGSQSIRYLDSSQSAYEQALTVRSESNLPFEWAATKNNLGIVLFLLGRATPGVRGRDLLERASDEYRAALRVRTRANYPADWAQTSEIWEML